MEKKENKSKRPLKLSSAGRLQIRKNIGPGKSFKNKQGEKGLVCEGVPCIDGNCLDKSYEMDADMVSSIAQLGALAQGNRINISSKNPTSLNLERFRSIAKPFTFSTEMGK